MIFRRHHKDDDDDREPLFDNLEPEREQVRRFPEPPVERQTHVFTDRPFFERAGGDDDSE
jgi:hypothetical protein